MTTTPTTTRYDDQLDVDLIRPNPRNPRTRLGDLTALAESIHEQGVLEPLLVEPDPEAEGEGWLLISGHRRLAAARKAGLDAVPAIIRGAASQDGSQIEAMLVENCQRADLTAVETADAYQALLDLEGGDYTPARIAQRVGTKKKTVTDHLKVVGLPESARQRIIRGQLTLEDAARLEPFRKDAATVARLERAAEAGQLAFHQAIHVEEERRRRTNAAKKALAAAKKAGHQVIDLDDPDLCEGLIQGSLEVEDLAADVRAFDDVDVPAAEEDRLVRAFVDEHSTCPDHALLKEIVDGDLHVTAVCLDPEQHYPQTQPADTPLTTPAASEQQEDPEEQERRRQEREAAEQRRREEDELRLQLRAAARTRRAFLGQVATQPEAKQLAKTLLLKGFDYVFNNPGGTGPAMQVLAEMLLPDLPDRTAEDPKALAARLKKRLESMSIVELVLASEVRESQRAERDLAGELSRWVWGQGTSDQKWLTSLVDEWGYELTDVEQQLRDKHDPAKAGDES